ncbi:MAG: hypothetical protein M1815_001901 [Lichina confinis]|nr:MAG: hypothetical protein M1815_001901 [Lichina confinis]
MKLESVISLEDFQYQINHFDDDRRGQVLASTIAVSVLPLIAVIVRFWSRKLKRTPWKQDDYCIVVALVFSFGMMVQVTVATRYGLGQQALKAGLDNVTVFFKIVYAYQLTYGFTITLVKACILMFYHRTFVSHGFRRTVWGMAAFILLYFVPFTTAAIFQCRPLRLAWNKTLDGVCIDYVAYFKAASIVNLVTDVLLLVMPLPVVWRLNITPRQKIAVTGIFTLGGFVCVVAGLRIPYVLKISFGGNPTMNSVEGFIWTNVEVAMSIVCACLPVMRPFFRALLKDGLMSGKSSQAVSDEPAWPAPSRNQSVETSGSPSETRLHYPVSYLDDYPPPPPQELATYVLHDSKRADAEQYLR